MTERLDQETDKPLFDTFMELFQVPSVFSFETNMALTEGMFKFFGSGPARKVMARMESHSLKPLPDKEVDAYMDMCVQCVTSVLREKERSFITSADPRGGSRIACARLLSKAVTSVRRKTMARRLREADSQQLSDLLDDAASMPRPEAAGLALEDQYRRLAGLGEGALPGERLDRNLPPEEKKGSMKVNLFPGKG
jgi:hypothetical protein